MAKTQNFKLGPKASSFAFPEASITILQGQSVEIPKEIQNHPYVAQAIRGGHIIPVTADDAKALKQVTKEAEVFEISKATKAQIIGKILEHDDNDEDEDDLSKRNKAELTNIYNDLYEVEEEDEEEEEDDEEEEDK